MTPSGFFSNQELPEDKNTQVFSRGLLQTVWLLLFSLFPLGFFTLGLADHWLQSLTSVPILNSDGSTWRILPYGSEYSHEPISYLQAGPIYSTPM